MNVDNPAIKVSGGSEEHGEDIRCCVEYLNNCKGMLVQIRMLMSLMDEGSERNEVKKMILESGGKRILVI